MKMLEIRKSGRDREYVYFMRGNKLCRQRYVVPTTRRTRATAHARGALGALAKAWRELTEEQRLAWIAAAAKVLSHPRLGQSGPLTGAQYFVGINSARAGIGREMLLWPPERVVFGPSPVEGLRISWENGRMRLKVRIHRTFDALCGPEPQGNSGPLTPAISPSEGERENRRQLPGESRSRGRVQDIMVFGAAPCSAGRKKWRHGAYLGLLPAPEGGESDITELYVARYGEPKVGERVFIRTRQQANGQEGDNKDISEVVGADESRKPKAESRRKCEIRSPKVAWSGGLAGAVGRIGRRGCTREQYRGFAIPAPWQCRRSGGWARQGRWQMEDGKSWQWRGAGGYPRPVRRAGPVCGVWALGEVRWNGHWRELWRGS
jgi:hypothetical protein